MGRSKQAEFLKRSKMHRGGFVKRQKFATGGAAAGAAIGSVIPGIGTAIGAIGGFIASLFGGGPKPPNIVDPVSGQQLTDAAGNVVASQQVLQNYANTLQGMNGAQNQQQAFQAVNQVYQGKGPNPAAAMLAEATGQNVANTEAMMASQRGAGQNAGLIARQAAQQGAATQQQAVGQAASLQSQQQLGALGQMGSIAAQQVQETQNQQQLAAQTALQNQQNLLAAQGQFQQTLAGGQANVNTTNADILSKVTAPALAGATQGLGTALIGNSAPPTTQPGYVTGTSNPTTPTYMLAPNSNKMAEGGRVVEGPHSSHVANFLAMSEGGKVPALVSPGERYLTPEEVKMVQHGHDPRKLGHKVPGKAKVKGDSLKNDTVKATLEEGGVVIPRHVESAGSSDKSRLFVLKSIAKKRGSHVR